MQRTSRAGRSGARARPSARAPGGCARAGDAAETDEGRLSAARRRAPCRRGRIRESRHPDSRGRRSQKEPMAPRRRDASPAQSSTTSFGVDSTVGYDQVNPHTGALERVAVKLKHIDRAVDPPSYTIVLPGGGERQTERHRLHVLRPSDGATFSDVQLADVARQRRFEQQLRGQRPAWQYSWVLTALATLALLVVTAPSEASLALYLTTRRDSSTLGQVRHSVHGLWNSLLGVSNPESESVTDFTSFGVLSVASVADGRSFLGVCGIWLEVPACEALVLDLPSIDFSELVRRIRQDGLASWSTHATHDLYAIAAINAVVYVLWSAKRQSWWWQDAMRRNFTVSRRNLCQKRYHTLITAVFSHEDLAHLAHNMLWLLAVGPEIQVQLGREQTLLLYVLGGICGALSSALVHGAHFEGVGASGAVYALEACNCCMQPHRMYVWAGMQVTSMQLLGSRLTLDVVSHFQGSRVDYAAHLGGAVAGAVYWWHCLRVSAGAWG